MLNRAMEGLVIWTNRCGSTATESYPPGEVQFQRFAQRRLQMIRTIQHIHRYLLWGVAFAVLGFLITGCRYFPESTFQLATESRLPKWIALPPGLTRADVSLTMRYYIQPRANDAIFILQDEKKQVVQRARGKVVCKQPFQLKSSSKGFASGYPSYEPITVNGTTEIIEHRAMEPIFYVTDDPAVWNQYRASGCG
jgi:hypothetical protein